MRLPTFRRSLALGWEPYLNRLDRLIVSIKRLLQTCSFFSHKYHFHRRHYHDHFYHVFHLTSTASQPESGVGDLIQDTERTSATHGSLTIAWPDSTPIKINIGAWLGDEPITLERFDGGGSVKVKGTSYAFPSEAVITVDRPSQITGQPPKSQLITYNSARVKWMDKLNLVEILDQNRSYVWACKSYQVDNQITTYL